MYFECVNLTSKKSSFLLLFPEFWFVAIELLWKGKIIKWWWNNNKVYDNNDNNRIIKWIDKCVCIYQFMYMYECVYVCVCVCMLHCFMKVTFDLYISFTLTHEFYNQL